MSGLQIWKRKYPYMREAIVSGRAEAKGRAQNTTTLVDYVYARLSPSLQKLWNDINACEELENGVRRIEALLDRAGLRARQQIFMHGMVYGNFNVSEACRKANISRQTFEHWRLTDPEFAQLLDDFHFHKKEFYESHLVSLVASGDSAATIFANKTYNRDRGYNEKIEHEIKGHVQHSHSVLVLDDLELPLEVRKAILQALRQKKQNVIDAVPLNLTQETEDAAA